ncbi:MAG: hypothetical protein ACKO2P_14170 [Planctomycetota bacterium]
MCPWGVRTGVRHYLLLIAVCALPCAADCHAQSGPPIGAGGSGDNEPVVILSDGTGRVPVLEVSSAVQQSSDPLHRLVWDTRETTRHRLLSTKDHTPWQIMHGLLGLRQDLLLSHNGQVINALQWIQTGPRFQNEPWFEKTVHGGRAHPYIKPYWFEGHINQFVAMLASCNLPLDAKFGTPTGPITMQDMLKNAQMTVNSREEVTWTLWALCTYLPPDARWLNAAGEEWSIEKLVQLETAKTVGGPTSPCGGTHGLFALARARNVYLRTGKPLRGAWFAADQKIRKYIETAKVYRNPDGSLSSGFFKTREYKQDFDKRMASQGHLLEFLMMSVSQDELKSDWVRRAVTMTCNDLNANQNQYVSCSPLFHAANALSIYLDRVAQEAPPRVAQNPNAAAGSLAAPRVKTAAPRPPKPEGADGIAPPAPPARGHLQIPPAANAPAFAAESRKQPAVPPASTAQYPARSENPQRPNLPANSATPAKPAAPTPSPPATPASPIPSSTAPGVPISNPRGVPVKSVSSSTSRPVASPQPPGPPPTSSLNPETKSPAGSTPAARPPVSAPKVPLPPLRPTSPVPPVPQTPPGGATQQRPPQARGSSVTKTSGKSDVEIILLEDFLSSPAPAQSTGQK